MTVSNSSFQNEAEKGRTSFAGEFIAFLANNKKWWLLPILLILALIAFLAFFATTGAAPFIYTLF